MLFTVVVGNLGEVHNGTSNKAAVDCYNSYVTLSQCEGRRMSGEPVTLFVDGEISQEYTPPTNTTTYECNACRAHCRLDTESEQDAPKGCPFSPDEELAAWM